MYERGFVFPIEVGDGGVPVGSRCDEVVVAAEAAAGCRETTHGAGAARLVQLLDVLDLLLRLHAAVLEPDLDLALGEAERVRDLDASLAREVAIELKLFFQFKRLVARVRLTASTSLRRVGTCRHSINDTLDKSDKSADVNVTANY